MNHIEASTLLLSPSLSISLSPSLSFFLSVCLSFFLSFFLFNITKELFVDRPLWTTPNCQVYLTQSAELGFDPHGDPDEIPNAERIMHKSGALCREARRAPVRRNQ